MKKRLMSVVLSAVMIVGLLAGCGSGKENEEDADGGDSSEVVEISWLHHFQEEGIKKWIEDCLTEFAKEEPNIKVTVEAVTQDVFMQTLKTKIASDDAPMIFDLSETDLVEYASAGHLTDLSDLEGLSNLEQSMIPGGQIDGVQYSVPLDMNGYGVFYNKDVFDQYNLEVPTTRTEMIEVCKILKNNGIQPIAGGFAEQWCLQAYFDTVSCPQYGDAEWWENKMNLSSDFSSDEVFKELIATFCELKEYWGDDPFGEDWDTAQSKVANGEAAMTVNGAWAIDGILAKNPDCNVRVFAFPATDSPEGAIMQVRPGNGFVLYNSDDEEKVAAGRNLLDFLTTKTAGDLFAKDASKMSMVTGVDVSFSEPLSDIKSYEGEQVWTSAGVTMFSTEYLQLFYETILKYVMEETIDIDGLAESLDQDFASISG